MRVDATLLARWCKYAELYMADFKLNVDDVTTPVMAWTVAHRIGIPKEAYHVGLNDTHIETALRRVFPKAWRTA